MSIAVTDKAVAAIKKASEARAARPKGLRVGIRGGGCTGFSYLFEWADTDPRPEDKVLSFEDDQVRVFIDPKSYLFLDGSTLDYATSMMARGFKFVNPNVKGTCGCGESVQFEERQGVLRGGHAR
jgi:iron-sulfur cluster assembly protein